MRSTLRLGAVNAALVSLYFAPVWGLEALRALTSPFSGFDDRAHAAVVGYFREIFDFGLDGLIRTSSVVAGVKLVIATGFIAYLIEFSRALVMGREPNRETLDIVLLLALVSIMFWAWPAIAAGDTGLVRLHATQYLLLLGAGIVIMIERNTGHAAEPATRLATAVRERDALRRAAASAALQIKG